MNFCIHTLFETFFQSNEMVTKKYKSLSLIFLYLTNTHFIFFYFTVFLSCYYNNAFMCVRTDVR